MSNKKIVILGAGLAGLSAAWHLQKKKIECSVFEKEPAVGGLCRSKKIKGFIFDCDGHLLHFRNKYTLQLVRMLLKGNLVSHKRSAWVNSFGIFSRYPFQANLCALPRPIAKECLFEFLKASQTYQDNTPDNLLKWINITFGKGIARHFMIPYNEKFWTVPLDKMISAWTDNFIPVPRPSEVIEGFFAENKHHFGYNATFWYPRQAGIGQLPLAFEQQLCNVHKGFGISAIDIQKKELNVAGKEKIKFDTLISTIPLPELAKIIRPLPGNIMDMFKKLRWNSIFNLNLGVEGGCQEGRHWIYFPHKDTVFFRVGFFHSFSNNTVPSGKSAIYTEVAYSKNRPVNKNKIIPKIINGLKTRGILGKKNRVSVLDINDIKYGYPIYDKYYLQATAAIGEFLSHNNIIACGRYGSWKYMSMEEAILDGRRVADKIIR
ncbi:MAG: FAD-dependent oxidoreductase [Candidatus Omnitrophica bacterium]|nr:FAD-dependent oxidoreductase [Candidatus Omnitrophota bacterium]MDD5691203.1 FAD-dependent oxidoreductase [Candidatus Omnitrophota bacterium]